MEPGIKPFYGTRYNPVRISNLSDVVCPPYDVISEQQLEFLRSKSPYNFSHILLADNNNYKEIAEKFRGWNEQGILTDDKSKSFYLYEQCFTSEGKSYRRFGFLSLLKMDNNILPHEHTLSKPKEDRKKIIKEMEANLSPIFVIAPRALGAFGQVYKSYSGKAPVVKFEFEGIKNSIWMVDDSDSIAAICTAVEKSSLIIADGHHRFEISYDYYINNKGKFDDLNYVLAYITDAQEGLLILPTHRIVRLKQEIGLIFHKLEDYFFIKPATKDYVEKELNIRKKFCFSIYYQERFYFLEPKDDSFFNKIDGEDCYKKIDSYILHQFIFRLFEKDEEIGYTHTISEACQLAGQDKAAFLLRSARLNDVFDIAKQGLRLPQKSTYFYPKLVSGVVVRRFGNYRRYIGKSCQGVV